MNVVGVWFFGLVVVGCDGGFDNVWGYLYFIVGDGLVYVGYL